MNQVPSRMIRLLILLTVTAALAARAEARADSCANLFKSNPTLISVRPLTLQQIHHVVLGVEMPGDPVLMIHGVGSNLETFRSVATEIAKSRKVVLFDLRGHGKTPDPGEGYDLPTLVSDIKVLATGLKLSRIQVVGHSAGAKLAMLFATQYPELVSSVVIEDSGVLPMGNNETLDKVREDARYLRSLTKVYGSSADLAKDLLPIAEADPEKALKLANKVYLQGTRQSAVTIEFWKNFKATDTSAFLNAFEKPTLFLRAAPGTRYFTAKDLEFIHSQMPKAKVISIEKSSHSIHETTPRDWLIAVKDFLL